MFTTFPAAFDANRPANSQQYQEADLTTNSPRSKRHQVARACVWCRTYRIKCDANYPCKNCKAKGRRCTDEKGKPDVRTFPHAIKEIERLKGRVKELEEQLKSYTQGSKEEQKDVEDQPVKLSVPLPHNLDPLRQHGGNKKYYNWDFISARTARSNQQCYGPSSSFYFIGQMTSYLDVALQQRNSDIQLSSASRCFSSPSSTGKVEFPQNFVQHELSLEAHRLPRSQEECFLNMFWQSYHWIYPVLDKEEFRAHYNSLWETSDTARKPSALVDIVLAICLQYGAALLPPCRVSTSAEDPEISDATIAGRRYYRSCQSLLTDELEGPSIMTFQCHLLSVIWLSNASFQNMAHSVMAMAVRTGIILGLHLEPGEEFSDAQRYFRKRLWWTLYALEMKMGMELGRPLAVHFSQVTCSIPDDSPSNRHLLLGQSNTDMTWFNAQFVKLILATRAIYITFYHRCAEVLAMSGQKSLYQDTQSLELCAEFLLSKAGYLKTWLQQVPECLRIERKNAGEPYSTDRSALEMPLQPSPSLWLPRQSLFLELLYHNLAMSLYRPFISFSRASDTTAPVTERHAISCVNHAITVTNIIFQTLTESDLLNGWHETFQWQWNATLSIIGYILAYPLGPSTTAGRKALSTAITIFELLSSSFASAVSATSVARDLSAKADLLIERSRTFLTLGYPDSVASLKDSPHPPFSSFTPLPEPDMQDWDQYSNSNLLMRLTEDQSSIFQNTLSSATGFAFAFDSCNGFGDVSTDGANAFDFLDFGDITGL